MFGKAVTQHSRARILKQAQRIGYRYFVAPIPVYLPTEYGRSRGIMCIGPSFPILTVRNRNLRSILGMKHHWNRPKEFSYEARHRPAVRSCEYRFPGEPSHSDIPSRKLTGSPSQDTDKASHKKALYSGLTSIAASCKVPLDAPGSGLAYPKQEKNSD